MKFLSIGLIAIILVSCNQEQPNEVSQPSSNTDKVIEVVTYHDNGVIDKKGTSINGKRVGTWESFYENGYKWSIVNYNTNGLKDGETMAFFPNGMMKWQGQYANDDRTGLWIFYDEKGIVLKQVDMDVEDIPDDSISK